MDYITTNTWRQAASMIASRGCSATVSGGACSRHGNVRHPQAARRCSLQYTASSAVRDSSIARSQAVTALSKCPLGTNATLRLFLSFSHTRPLHPCLQFPPYLLLPLAWPLPLFYHFYWGVVCILQTERGDASRQMRGNESDRSQIGCKGGMGAPSRSGNAGLCGHRQSQDGKSARRCAQRGAEAGWNERRPRSGRNRLRADKQGKGWTEARGRKGNT